MSRMPLSARGRRPAFFENKAIDSMVTMMLELSAELWVVKERQRALEDLLETSSPGLAEKMQAWQPDDEMAAALAAERQNFLRTILRTLESEFTPRAEIQRDQDQFGDETIAEGNTE
ncbi:MAG: hypothetical protein AB8F65_00665 [Woeseiaceae bacterium]